MSVVLQSAAARPPGRSPQGPPRPLLRRLAWALAGLLGLPALLALAWLLSNLSDLPAAPRPAALQVPAPSLPAERNAHFALQALRAPPGEDLPDAANAAQREWLQQQARAALPVAQRFGPAGQPLPRAVRTSAQTPAAEPWQAGPNGPPWVCDAGHAACTDAWLAQPEALAAQRAAAAWGARCNALLEDPAFAWEEPLQQPLRLAAVAGAPIAAADCSAWFLSGAVLAHGRGDRAETLRQLGHADRLHRALQAGSHSLLSQVVAMRLAHRWLETSTTLAGRDPGLAAPLAPLLEGWPQPLEAIGRWMAFESSLTVAALDEMFEACALPGLQDPGDGLSRLTCRYRIGLQRERTLQASDARWLQRLAAAGADWPSSASLVLPETPAWVWRNTFGHVLIHVADSSYGTYTQRHADLALHLRAAQLALALQREAVPAAARADWLARQPLQASERARLQLQDEGQTLVLRPSTAPLRIALPR